MTFYLKLWVYISQFRLCFCVDIYHCNSGFEKSKTVRYSYNKWKTSAKQIHRFTGWVPASFHWEKGISAHVKLIAYLSMYKMSNLRPFDCCSGIKCSTNEFAQVWVTKPRSHQYGMAVILHVSPSNLTGLFREAREQPCIVCFSQRGLFSFSWHSVFPFSKIPK